MSPLLLAKHHSLFLTRPRLADHYSDPRETAEGIGALFDMVRAGKVRPHVGERYPLSDVASAHKALEARQTVGSTVLLV